MGNSARLNKLAEKELIDYEPYKGVTLTTQGERLAHYVLRCRRLWEVFFVEKLGLEPKEAEAMACRFEHVTAEALTERLALFLGQPTLSPQDEPIPSACRPGAERHIRVWKHSSLPYGKSWRLRWSSD